MKKPALLKTGLLLVSLSLLSFGEARAQEYTVHGTVLGEYWSKYGPTLADSTGLIAEITAGALKNANLSVKVAPDVPWPRAQADAVAEADGIITGFARTPAREANWKWVTTLYSDKVYGYTMKGKPVFASYDELKDKKPIICAKLGSASDSILKGLGVEVDANNDMDKNFKKLMLGRADVVVLQAMEVYPAIQLVVKGADADSYKPKIADLQRTLVTDLPLWMAVSPKTSDADVQKLKDAVENFKKTPEYAAIVKKYESKLDNLLQ